MCATRVIVISIFYTAFNVFRTFFFTIPNIYQDRNFSTALSLMSFPFASKSNSALSGKPIKILYFDLSSKCIHMENVA